MPEQTQDITEQDRERARAGAAAVVIAFLIAAAFSDVALLLPALVQTSPNAASRAASFVVAPAAPIVWGSTLLREWKRRHYWEQRRWFRGLGWCGQSAILLLGGIPSGLIHHWRPIVAAVAANLVAAAAWHIWMKCNLLAPDDQAVLDQIVNEYNRDIAPVRDAQRRLDEIRAASAPFMPTVPTAEAGQPLAFDVPKGRHEPLVYFIRHGNRVKIGTTVDLHKRVRALSLRMDNVALVLPGDADVEKAYHRRFDALRVGDTEWFTDEPRLTDFIAAWAEKAGRPHE